MRYLKMREIGGGAARAARKRKRLTSNRGKLKGDTNKLVKEEEKEEEKMPCNQSA